MAKPCVILKMYVHIWNAYTLSIVLIYISLVTFKTILVEAKLLVLMFCHLEKNTIILSAPQGSRSSFVDFWQLFTQSKCTSGAAIASFIILIIIMLFLGIALYLDIATLQS